jgi:hypothetical protein
VAHPVLHRRRRGHRRGDRAQPVKETTTAEVRKKKEAGSMLGLLTVHWKPALVVAGFTAGGSLAYYTYATYMQTYLINTAGLPKTTVTYIMTAALFVFMCVQPLYGALSDQDRAPQLDAAVRAPHRSRDDPDPHLRRDGAVRDRGLRRPPRSRS